MGYNFEKLSGRSKELLGKASGNRRMELRGKAQHHIAEMKDKATQSVRDIEASLNSERG